MGGGESIGRAMGWEGRGKDRRVRRGEGGEEWDGMVEGGGRREREGGRGV